MTKKAVKHYFCHLTAFINYLLHIINHKDLLLLTLSLAALYAFLQDFKPLKMDNKYKYIVSGSELGIALSKTTLTPMGSIIEKKMYPMDFEEFLIANNVGQLVIDHLRKCFNESISLEESLHNKILYLFKTYLYVGGMPDAVKTFVETKNVYKVREIQKDMFYIMKEK